MPTIEDRVQTRLDADQAAQKAVLDATNKAVKVAGKDEFDLREKMVAALDLVGAGALLDKPKPPTEAQREQVADLTRRHTKAVNAFLTACQRRSDALATQILLGSAKERDRRLKQAKSVQGKAKTDDVLAGPDAAEVVLISQGRPMHYAEITRVALETGIVRLAGKTPEATMSAYLAKAVAKGDRFVRVDAGVFDLKDRTATPKAAAEQAEPQAA